MRRTAILAGLLPAGLLLAFAARFAPGAVETLYARGAYRGVAAAFAVATGWIPFSIAEPLLVIALGLAAWRLARHVRAMVRPAEPRWRLLLRAALDGAAVLGVGYAAFLLLWGLNYCREPLAISLRLPVRESSAGELGRLHDELVDEANALRANLPEDGEGVLALADPEAEARAAYEALAKRDALFRGVYGRPKRAWLGTCVLSLAGVAGIYCPFTGEPHVNPSLPGPAMASTICHEMAHHRGFAAEDEADFVGILACRASASPATRYSGVLAALLHVRAALGTGDRGRLSAGVVRDSEAIARWVRTHTHRVAASVGERVNDAYLRANAQRDGVRSYGRVVDLLLAQRRAQGAGDSEGTTSRRKTAPSR